MWDVENSMVLDSEWGGREYCDGGNFSGLGHWEDDEPEDDYDNARDMWDEEHEE